MAGGPCLRLFGGAGLRLVTQFSQVMHVFSVTSCLWKFKGEFRGDEVGRGATLLQAVPGLDRDRPTSVLRLEVEQAQHAGG